MSEFKGRHFRGEIVLWAVRWYCRYAVSYRDLEAMMTERGVAVDHSTIYRPVQRFGPDMEKRLRWQWRRPQSASWRIDETYVKVRGKKDRKNNRPIRVIGGVLAWSLSGSLSVRARTIRVRADAVWSRRLGSRQIPLDRRYRPVAGHERHLAHLGAGDESPNSSTRRATPFIQEEHHRFCPDSDRRSACRSLFLVPVFGRSATNSTMRGYLNGSRRSFTNSCSSVRVASLSLSLMLIST